MCKHEILNAIALALGIAAVVLTFTGVPGGVSLEPILGIAIFCLALANMKTCKMPARPAARSRRRR